MIILFIVYPISLNGNNPFGFVIKKTILVIDNTISVKQIEKSLQEFGLSNNQFVLRSQKANEKNIDNTQLVIEIDKTK